MLVLINIILVFTILYIKTELKNERKEKEKYKKQVNILKEFIKKYIPEGKDLSELNIKEQTFETLEENANNNANFINEEKITKANTENVLHENLEKVKKNSNKVKEEDKKNVLILLTGAVLIVLSAIVFLLTTWYTIPNILKTLVLICLIAVFLGSSKIAKNKFKLEKASLAFFYIAMAYIPICLYSISIFKLFGEYLSIYGAGKYIYLTISGIVVSLIYYYYYKNINSKALLYGSILVQELTIILFTCVLKIDFNLIIINLSLYNIILMLTVNEIKENALINIYKIVPYILLLLNLCNFNTSGQLLEIRLLILAINFLILELKHSEEIYSYMLNILYILASTIFINNIEMFSSVIKEIVILLNVIIVFCIENLIILGKNKTNLEKSLIAVSLITLMILQLEFSYIKPYIMSMVIIIFALIAYIKSKEIGKELSAYIIPIYFITAGITLYNDLELSYHYIVIFSLICFIIGEFITGKNFEKLKNKSFIISHIFMIIVYTYCFKEYANFADDIFYYFALMIIYVYSFWKNQKNRIFKYLAYISFNILLASGYEFFKIKSSSVLYSIPTITTLGIIALENKYKEIKLKDSFSDIYISISKIIAFILLSNSKEVGLVLAIILAGVSIYINVINKQKQYLDIIPLFGILPSIINCNIDENVRILLFVGITIAITIVSIYKSKLSVYTIFSLIYLGYLADYINNEYCTQILFLLWSLIHCIFEKNDKFKDFYKVFLYIIITNLYYIIISDIKLDDYTLFNILGILLFTICIFKNICKKYIKTKDLEFIEYIVYGIIYICAITSYVSLPDAMLFLILITCMIIYSYMKKYGTLFIVNIIAILVNVFYLTKEFWLAIPWWLYLLCIGSVLISFAIRNEVKDNNEKLNIGKVINKIKDNVEK